MWNKKQRKLLQGPFYLVFTLSPRLYTLTFAIARCKFFVLAPFLSFFSALLLSFPFAFHILSGCRKKLGVQYGQSPEMGPWPIIGIMDHFTTSFALCFSICNVRMPSKSKPAGFANKFILALPFAYQEYLVTYKLMTSQVIQRARKLNANIWDLGRKRVNKRNLWPQT